MWKPIAEHVFPWEPDRLTVACVATDGSGDMEVFICACADGGLYYPLGGILTCEEVGWSPFAWTDAPPTSTTPPK